MFIPFVPGDYQPVPPCWFPPCYDPCRHCRWRIEPWFGIVSPCANCQKDGAATTTALPTYTTNRITITC